MHYELRMAYLLLIVNEGSLQSVGKRS